MSDNSKGVCGPCGCRFSKFDKYFVWVVCLPITLASFSIPLVFWLMHRRAFIPDTKFNLILLLQITSMMAYIVFSFGVFRAFNPKLIRNGGCRRNHVYDTRQKEDE